jgi:hypothetical protein
MALYSPHASGLGNSAAYQVSGKPYASTGNAPSSAGSADPTEILFPTVTKQITFVNNGTTGQKIRIGFSHAGVDGTNYILVQPVVDGGVPITLDTKITKLYIISDGSYQTAYSLYAGLTGVPDEDLPNSWLGSAGVGGTKP